MLSRLRPLWWRLAASLWFVPALMVLLAMLLAVGLVEVDALYETELGRRWPRVFGVGHDGSRAMLTAIAGSMITVAGVVFSVTIVALSLAASQYSPRVLRTFTSDRTTQVVLGVFVGIFAYCLVVLRTIRGGDEDGFVPSLAVLGGLVLALIGIGFLVYFIHHLAASIQASSILSRVAGATSVAMDDLFPETLGAPLDEHELDTEAYAAGPWAKLVARRTGYLINVDNAGLLAFARERGRVLRMEAEIGEFVIEGQALASLQGSEAVTAADEQALDLLYAFDRQRTLQQDAAFGLQQVVDIGSKALSPGINDASTAVLCIDRLTELLVRLSRRRIETPYRREEGRLRVIARGPTFAGLVEVAYHALRGDAASKPLVIHKLLWSIEQVARATSDAARRKVLAEQASRFAEQVRQMPRSRDWQDVCARVEQLERELQRPSDGDVSPRGSAGP